MLLLTSPGLTEPAKAWEDWLIKLSKMPQDDATVQYMQDRAERVLANKRKQEPGAKAA